AKNQLSSNARFKWKNALASYQRINVMYEEIRKSPGALRVIPNPKNYYSKVAELKLKAAEESYKDGLAALALNTRESAKTAYFHFMDANELSPGYKDVEDLIVESQLAATLKVVIEQIPVPGKYQLSGGFFQDKIESFVHQPGVGGPFVRFFTPQEAAELETIDQIMHIRFDDFVVGETHLLQKEENLSKDSVKVGEATLADGTKQPVYSTVTAKLITYHKEVKSSGLVSLRIVDPLTNSVIKHEKFNSEFIWINDWGHFNGDERALDKQHFDIVNQKEIQPPPPQDLFFEFSKPIYDQVTQEINNFYKRF
ncbi:MAG: hypothetical protein OEX02_19555, partial [Cyclobacteriaceae bacterium]|nr:hypothetical protein [Cyclobacteriaceae bacterium]